MYSKFTLHTQRSREREVKKTEWNEDERNKRMGGKEMSVEVRKRTK